jgi:Spy/CpxP family protein refolding chaperone
VVVIAAFLAGVVAGVGGEFAWLVHNRRILPRPGGHFAKRLVERLDHELHFDAKQRASVEAIIEAHRKRIDATWSSVRPQVEKEIDATNAEIEKLLSPEQREKFKALQAKMRSRARHVGAPPPGPPPRD